MRRLPNCSRDDGATAIEVALVLPMFLATVLMTFYGGLYLYYAAVAEHVARHAVRDATLPMSGTSTYPTTDQVYATAKSTGGALIPAPTTVSLASTPYDDPPREGDEVTVTVTYHLPAVQAVADALWFLPKPPTDVTRTATGRRE
jgi:Flp pilus assembly protein TadG